MNVEKISKMADALIHIEQVSTDVNEYFSSDTDSLYDNLKQEMEREIKEEASK